MFLLLESGRTEEKEKKLVNVDEKTGFPLVLSFTNFVNTSNYYDRSFKSPF